MIETRGHNEAMGADLAPTLAARNVSKRFGGVVALDDVSIAVRAGEITGLVGDNGAGKSTLIRIVSAVLSPDSGTVELDGEPVHFASPAEARAAGIETVYQDLALAGNMPVWANVYLGRELTRGPHALNILDKRRMVDGAARCWLASDATCRRSTPRPRSFPAGSGRRSPLPAPPPGARR